MENIETKAEINMKKEPIIPESERKGWFNDGKLMGGGYFFLSMISVGLFQRRIESYLIKNFPVLGEFGWTNIIFLTISMLIFAYPRLVLIANRCNHANYNPKPRQIIVFATLIIMFIDYILLLFGIDSGSVILGGKEYGSIFYILAVINLIYIFILSFLPKRKDYNELPMIEIKDEHKSIFEKTQ